MFRAIGIGRSGAVSMLVGHHRPFMTDVSDGIRDTRKAAQEGLGSSLRRRRISIDSNPGWGSSVGECLVASGSPPYGGAGRPGLSLFGVQQLGSFDSIFTETVGNGNFARFRMNVNLENFTTY